MTAKDGKNLNDKSLEAEYLAPERLVRFFEPNDLADISNAQNRALSSYDRIAQVGGASYLVADRGVGKTHILTLLSHVLSQRGDIFIKIELKNWIGYSLYQKMTQTYSAPNQKVLIWKIAILEEVLIQLVEKYYFQQQFPKSKKVSSDNLQVLRGNFSDLTQGAFKSYFKIHKRSYWAEKHQLEDFFEQIGSALREIKITFTPPTTPPAPVTVTSSKQQADPKKVEEINTHYLSETFRILKNKCLEMMRVLNKIQHDDLPSAYNAVTLHLPKSYSVYVIADGLDQTNNPVSHEDLISLLSATKDLNQLNAENFKMVVSFRSITFDVLKKKYEDMEQDWDKVEPINWSPAALKRMVARRISVSDDVQSNQVDSLIYRKFPQKFHYFGKEFDTMDFIFGVTGHRPRQIIRLWTQCAEVIGEKDKPFSAHMSEKDIMKGFREYSLGTLPSDIGQEYSLEHPWLNDFFKFLASVRYKISRATTTESIEEIIDEYKKRREEMGKALEGEVWKKTIEIVNIMFQIGIIGYLPTDKIDFNWNDLQDVYKQPQEDMRNHRYIGFSPKMWNYLTNIRDETIQRRKFSLMLYETFRKQIRDLSASLNSKNSRDLLEYQIGVYLAMGKVIKEISIYPEPADWEDLDKCRSGIKKSWEILEGLTTYPVDRKIAKADVIDFIATQYKDIMVNINAEEFSCTCHDFAEFCARKKSTADYKNITNPLENFLGLYKKGIVPAYTQQFIKSLTGDSESLEVFLSDSIGRLENLLSNVPSNK